MGWMDRFFDRQAREQLGKLEDAEALAELRQTVIVIEALGSIREAERLGWFRFREAPKEVVEQVYQLTPTSRDGRATGTAAEQRWQSHVERIIAETGDAELFTRTRRRILDAAADAPTKEGRLGEKTWTRVVSHLEHKEGEEPKQ